MTHRVAMLCNGPSLVDHPLNRIDCETIGLNRSWEVMRSTHHVMLDNEQWEFYKRTTGKPDFKDLRTLYTHEDGPGDVKLRVMDTVEPRFSFEPMRHGVFGCRAVTWVGLQLARALGYTEIYMIGLDLKTRQVRSRAGHTELAKFYGGQPSLAGWARQRELMGYAAGLFQYLGIKVYNVNQESACKAFPFRSFDECFGGRG